MRKPDDGVPLAAIVAVETTDARNEPAGKDVGGQHATN